MALDDRLVGVRGRGRSSLQGANRGVIWRNALSRGANREVQRHVHRVAVGQNVEYAASDLGDGVIDTTDLCIEETVEHAL